MTEKKVTQLDLKSEKSVGSVDGVEIIHKIIDFRHSWTVDVCDMMFKIEKGYFFDVFLKNLPISSSRKWLKKYR